jgi:AAHS family 4-hydroxybenzoate transporter-like MFS transporter
LNINAISKPMDASPSNSLQNERGAKMENQDVVDVAQAIDNRGIGGKQLEIFALCFACLLADGFDAQALGYAIPVMSKAWGVVPAAFTTALSMGLAGMVVGALALGSLADYFGRRRVILICTALFGLSTVCIALVTDMSGLTGWRFLAGVGLGGCVPNALAMVAEYSPARTRATVVMVTACAMSLGSAVGGVIAGWLMPKFGWPVVFWVGGIFPLVLVVVMSMRLSESIRFLTIKNQKTEELSALLGKICRATFSPSAKFKLIEHKVSGLTVKNLFSEGRALSTLLIWTIYAMCLLDIYFFASWLPTLLHKADVPLQRALMATSSLHVAGIVASLLLGRVLDRFNARRVLALLYFLGAISIVAIGVLLDSHTLLLVATFCAGFCMVGGQSGMHVVTSQAYPTFMRSTGMGWALGIGRMGSIFGSIIGGTLLGMNWDAGSMLYVGAIPAITAAIATFVLSILHARTTKIDPASSSQVARQS